MEQLFYTFFKNGTVTLPSFLLQQYKHIGLTDEEMMLILHIMELKQSGKDFPSIYDLKNRMTAEEYRLIPMLQGLVKNAFLFIEDAIDEQTGIRSEIIHIDPLFKKLAALLIQQQSQSIQVEADKEEKEQEANLFTVFEQEFGRPLSPLECETLTIWKDNDFYSDNLIIAALREAVISGKLSFRYVDRILFEWQRNNIRTPQQARDFSLKFRKPASQSQAQKKVEPFPFYNWLENEK